MKKFVALCACAFLLASCEKEETPKEKQETTATQSEVRKNPLQAVPMNEAQVFAYIMGCEYGMPAYLNTPPRIGEMLDLDAMVQGIVDNESVLKDSSRVLQLSQETQNKIEEYYRKQAEERSAAGENAKPIVLAGPIKGGNVILTDASAPIIMYSYMQGVQIHYLFDSIRRNFGEDFDNHFFIMGVRESIFNAMDPSFQKSVPDDTLKAVNARYMQRMEKIREERRKGNM